VEQGALLCRRPVPKLIDNLQTLKGASMQSLRPAVFVAVSLFPIAVSYAQADQPGIVRTEFIYETAPFPSCHASTIAETSDGLLVTAWFGGTRERDPDVGIWLSRYIDGRWTEPVEVANGVQYRGVDGEVRRHPCWNPVLFQPKDGPLMLFYKVGPSPSTWWGMLTTSGDGGATWSLPRRLPEQIDGPVKNKPVQPWQRTGPVNEREEFGAIQPSILMLGGDKLMALGRTRQRRVFQIESDDLGQTWGKMSLTNLPNPNAGTDAVTLKDGRHLLVYNHAGRGRTPLNVAVSGDGKTWQAALVLENQPGEYSYPAVIQTADGQVHITYTWMRQRIRHVVVDPTQLALRDLVDGKWPE
jgi:predicted neuraminidase